MRRHLCDSYKELTISIDGFSDFHNAMRGWAAGFEKLRLWISTLSNEAQRLGSRLKLRANVVLMRQNVKEFGSLCRELANWGIVEITYNQLGGRDRPEFYPTHRLRYSDVDSLERQLPELRQDLLEKGVTLVGGEEYLTRIRASALDECIPIDDCGPGEGFLFVDEVGRISPCSFTTIDYGIDFRTVETAIDLAALPSRFRELRSARRSTQCDNCLSTQVCGKFKRSSDETSAKTNLRQTHRAIA
jgi:radical SAM protein with 4Fe4S-binding SPASM domain